MSRRVLPLIALVACTLAYADDSPTSATVLGGANQHLLDAADALRVGDAERAIRLSLLGLDESPTPMDRVGALSNLCAAYTLAEQYDLAVVRCSEALALEPRWQAYHNRALAYMHLRRLDAAARDIEAGFAIFPESKLLTKAQAALEQLRRAPAPAPPRRVVMTLAQR
jgi:tetratricopeptide (TPR) repeat protein